MSIVNIGIISFFSSLLFLNCFAAKERSDNDMYHYFLHDVKDLKKHLGSQVDMKDYDPEKATRLNFVIHDIDKNGKIDGLEARRMVIHHYEDEGKDSSKLDDKTVMEMVDRMIKMSDTDNDQLISYEEFSKIIKTANET